MNREKRLARRKVFVYTFLIAFFCPLLFGEIFHQYNKISESSIDTKYKWRWDEGEQVRYEVVQELAHSFSSEGSSSETQDKLSFTLHIDASYAPKENYTLFSLLLKDPVYELRFPARPPQVFSSEEKSEETTLSIFFSYLTRYPALLQMNVLGEIVNIKGRERFDKKYQSALSRKSNLRFDEKLVMMRLLRYFRTQNLEKELSFLFGLFSTSFDVPEQSWKRDVLRNLPVIGRVRYETRVSVLRQALAKGEPSVELELKSQIFEDKEGSGEEAALLGTAYGRASFGLSSEKLQQLWMQSELIGKQGKGYRLKERTEVKISTASKSL